MLFGTWMLMAAISLMLVAGPRDTELRWGHLFQKGPTSAACSAALGQHSML